MQRCRCFPVFVKNTKNLGFVLKKIKKNQKKIYILYFIINTQVVGQLAYNRGTTTSKKTPFSIETPSCLLTNPDLSNNRDNPFPPTRHVFLSELRRLGNVLGIL
jgi:hypothetical protein